MKKIFETNDNNQPLFFGRLLDGLTIFHCEQDSLRFLSKMKTPKSALNFAHETSNQHAMILDFNLKYQNGLHSVRSIPRKPLI